MPFERRPFHILRFFCYAFTLIPIVFTLAGCSSSAPANADKTQPVKQGAMVKISTSGKRLVRYQQPDFLTYDELVSISNNPAVEGSLKKKIERFWKSPVISNEAYYSGKRPYHQSVDALGETLRVASWNIEKSLTMPQVAQALTSAEAYDAMIHSIKAPQGSTLRSEMKRQRDRLASADVIFLQEMDIGISRSDYIDAARLLAKALGMNYAYAPQALEIDPVLLGLEAPINPAYSRKKSDQTSPQIAGAKIATVDKAKYKGVFGSAILSRYPILNVEVFQLKTQPYDWYKGEIKPGDMVEEGRRLGSAWVFENVITRELKIGGRNFFRVDIAVPQVPGGVVSLINNHLEIKTLPKGREMQMQEILDHVKKIPHPVIMAGDHNSAPNDVSATSIHRVIWRMVDNPAAFVATASNVSGLLTGTMIPLYRERGVLNILKNFQDPLAPNVPILFPNSVLGLFNRVKDFRFDDGSSFDFRGDEERSINGRTGLLANSNEKHLKGQSTTFSMNRPIGPIGRYRLDWFFVKSGHLKSALDTNGSYRFAPHFGETLGKFNDGLASPLSDHRPIVIDLPFHEPKLK